MSDIGVSDPNRDTRILTRCLAAFAVAKVTGCSNIEAGASVWDGSDDNGIDAAFYDADNSQVVLVQSKWIKSGSGEPAASEVGAFINGVEDVVENRVDNFGTRLRDRVEAIGQELLKPGTTVHIELITTGNDTLSKHSRQNVSRLVDGLNGDGAEDDPIASFDFTGLNGVFDAVTDIGNLGKVNIEVTLQNWSRISEPFQSFFGTIDGYQLKFLWKTHGKRLVSKNIRHSLGPTEVNMQIANTAECEPQNFWYFNNGITLISDDITKAPALAASKSTGVFGMRAASIVNGAQTVSTISGVTNDESLGKTQIPIRIISLKSAPEGFGERVTRTNNSQNRVEGRDFVSEDPEQSRIKREMALEGVNYEYHRGETSHYSENSCDLIEVTTALACASNDPTTFIAIKTGVGRFFNDLSKPPYKTLFNPRTSGPKAFNAVRFLRECDDWIEQKKSSVEKRSGYQWGLLVHGNRAIAALAVRLYGLEKLETEIKDFGDNLRDDVNRLCDRSYSEILKILDDEYPNKFLAVLFKRPALGRVLFERIAP